MEMSNYGRMFNKYYSGLVFFAQRLLQQRENGEEIVSNVFILLWQKRHCFESEPKVKAFLYISTKNACFNAIKQAQRQSKDHDNYRAGLCEEDLCILDTIIRAEVLRKLHSLIESLPPECGKIMRMQLGGQDKRQIAGALGLSIHTVKNQVQRGLYLLRKKLKNRSDLLIVATVIFGSIATPLVIVNSSA
jgi:RNA polymerase sigma-70 factor (family 1)